MFVALFELVVCHWILFPTRQHRLTSNKIPFMLPMVYLSKPFAIDGTCLLFDIRMRLS
jgi:hypothetical protein